MVCGSGPETRTNTWAPRIDPSGAGSKLVSRIVRYAAALRSVNLTPELLPAGGYRAATVARVAMKAVLTLPPRYREPIVLFYFQEMDVSETARILGIPEGTLKARLHRARELLRRKATASRESRAPRAPRDE